MIEQNPLERDGADEAAEGRQPQRISVVIVSLNRVARLRESLEALGDAHQVIVVDNGSRDGSAQMDVEFPHVRFSKLPKNFGLTKALNIGIRAAEGEYILLLHDDVQLDAAGVTRLADFLAERSDVAAVCPLLDGPQVGNLPVPGASSLAWSQPSGSGEITAPCVSGAAILFRTAFLRALRHIDERYGTFGSEIELCEQVRRAGKKIVILTDVKAHHEAGESPVKAAVLAADRISGTAAYLAKHHGFSAGLAYRLQAGLASLVTFRFKSLGGAVAGTKIDGTA